jgi:hypothetical protein
VGSNHFVIVVWFLAKDRNGFTLCEFSQISKQKIIKLKNQTKHDSWLELVPGWPAGVGWTKLCDV